MYLVWSGEWDCGATPIKCKTLEELQDWLKNWCNTPIESLEFYHKLPDDWLPFFRTYRPVACQACGAICFQRSFATQMTELSFRHAREKVDRITHI